VMHCDIKSQGFRWDASNRWERPRWIENPWFIASWYLVWHTHAKSIHVTDYTTRSTEERPFWPNWCTKEPQVPTLLPQETLVKGELLTLENVSVTAAALAWAGGHDGKDTTSLELPLESGLDFARCLHAIGLLLGDAVRLLLFLLLLTSLGLSLAADSLAIVCLKPRTEGSGIDLNDGGLGKGVGSDEFVVGRVIDDTDDTALLRDALGAPREVARVETQSTELAVAATGADKMDTLSANTGIGGLATLLESPIVMSDMTVKAIGLCIPLLAVVCPLRTGSGALVARVSWDTAECQLLWRRGETVSVDTPWLRLFRRLPPTQN
jgi:hypothetical protein